jgi:hypothetical protein
MSLFTLRTGASAHPEDSVLQLYKDLIRSGGVINLGSTNHFKVTQHAAGANMSIDILPGDCFTKGSGNAYPIRNTSTINLVVTGNTSGNPRKDTVVVYNDLNETPTTNCDNVAKTVIIAGTPAASPSAPDDAAIQTAIGASNPFLRLGDFDVAHNASQIQTANITDKRIAFKLAKNHQRHSVTCANTTNLDFSEFDILEIALDRSPTFVFQNLGVDDMGLLVITNDNGARTITWPANIIWFGGTPALSGSAGAIDSFIILCKTAGDNPTYYGWPAGYGGV